MIQPGSGLNEAAGAAGIIEAGVLQWERALTAAALTWVSPGALGGIRLRAGAGPVRKAWLEAFQAMSPGADPLITLPASASPDRLRTHLSPTRSLLAGELVYEPGLLESARGGALIVNMAERQDVQVCALIASALDEAGCIGDGAICTVLFDEGVDGDAVPPKLLTDRLAFDIDLNATPYGAVSPPEFDAAQIADARERFHSVHVSDEVIESVVSACGSLAVRGVRASLFCINAAKGLAALDGRSEVAAEDVAAACALVLPERVEQRPADPPPQQQESNVSSEPQPPSNDDEPSEEGEGGEDAATRLIEAVEAVPGARLRSSTNRRPSRKASGPSGRSGDTTIAEDMGRPARSVRKRGSSGRVDILATLRAAAPLQAARRKAASRDGLIIKPGDLRMKRFLRRKQSCVIFVVDASGSSAMQRMSEAKGAVLRLLAECYTRRDLVSLIAFRGAEAELLLAPTRSLVAARRRLLDLPGGGGTPLPRAILSAGSLAMAEAARGRSPFIVFLSDGRGNVALDGSADRDAAAAQAEQLARRLAIHDTPCLFFDTSRRPAPHARQLSDALGADYAFLPVADGAAVSRAVRSRMS